SIVVAAQWYAAATCLALLFWPLACTLLPGSRDCGWGFARTVSAQIIIYVAWLLASLKVLPWGVFALATAALIIGSLSGALICFRKPGIIVQKQMKIGKIVGTELVFAIFFITGAVIRSWKPEIIGLEKFMNWALINAILISPSLPPPDPWLAGYSM